MSKIFSLVIFCVLVVPGVASPEYEEAEKRMQAYVGNPTDASLSHFYASIESLGNADYISLGVKASQFRQELFQHLQCVPSMPTKIVHFNVHEGLYRHAILILNYLRPHLDAEQKWIVKTMCESYYTLAPRHDQTIMSAFAGLEDRFSIKIERISLKAAALTSLHESRLLDLSSYGAHALDTYARQNPGKASVMLVPFASMVAYSSYSTIASLIF